MSHQGLTNILFKFQPVLGLIYIDKSLFFCYSKKLCNDLVELGTPRSLSVEICLLSSITTYAKRVRAILLVSSPYVAPALLNMRKFYVKRRIEHNGR